MIKFGFLVTLFILCFSRGVFGYDQSNIRLDVHSISKNRNIYDKVSIDLNAEVLSIISGKFKNETKVHTSQNQKTSKSIIYNRVNKCGSTSLLQLVEDLGFQNGYVVVSHGLPKVRTLLEEQKWSLSSLLCDPAAARLVLSRHLNYVDWAEYGCKIMHFNQVESGQRLSFFSFVNV